MTHLTSDQNSSYHSITKPAYDKDEWDHDYYGFVDSVDENMKKSGLKADRPSTLDAPDNCWYEATDEGIIYRNDPTYGWIKTGKGREGVGFVGSPNFEYETIQEAIDNEKKAIITSEYDPTNEDFPILLNNTDYLGKVIEGDHQEEIGISSNGAGFIKIDIVNTRSPGVNIRNLSVRDHAPGDPGDPTFNIIGTSHSNFQNITVDHDHQGSTDGFRTSENANSSPNSNTFISCRAEECGGTGFRLGANTHATIFLGCRSYQNGEYGFYLDGQSTLINIVTTEIQHNGNTGIRIRNARNVMINGGYFESNSEETTGGEQADIRCQNGADAISVKNCWFHGRGDVDMDRAINHNSQGTLEVQNIRWNEEYINIVQMFDGYLSMDRQSLVDTVGGTANPLKIEDSCDGVFDGPLIVGAGSVEAGNNDATSGVNLGSFDPPYVGAMAISDGTTTGTPGLTAVAISSTEWQPSDGGSTISST